MKQRILIFLVLLLWGSSAYGLDGVRVFVNGKDVTGVRHIKLKGVSVRFDPQGNVHVGAPGYTVNPPPKAKKKKPPVPAKSALKPDAPTPPGINTGQRAKRPAGAPPERRYFVSIERRDAAVLGCKISLVVDGREIHEVTGQEAREFQEITGSLVQGPGKLAIRIRRPPNPKLDRSKIPKKTLRDAFLKVSMGEGGVANARLDLKKVFGEVRCTDRSGGFVERVFPIVVK